MASAKTLLWIERLIWILIYGGLFALVLGFAILAADTHTGWSLVVLGSCVAGAGAILIWVRSRLTASS